VLIGLELAPQFKLLSSQFQCVLTYTVENINLASQKMTSSFQDELVMEDFSLVTSDYMLQNPLLKGKFSVEY